MISFNRVRFGVSLLLDRRQRKHFQRWLRSFDQDYLLSNAVPWICFDAADMLADHLSVLSQVFEYGSGGSTVFFARRGIRCVSVEHDRSWFERVREVVGASAVIDVRWVPPDGDVRLDTGDPADPGAYLSADSSLERRTMKNYVSAIDEFAERSLDVVLIDGRARTSCIKHAAPRVRPGGLLVLDNSDRDYYLRHTRPYLTDFEEHRFRGATPGVPFYSTTSIFVRSYR